ncbi:DUF5069 domain-containing protein [Cerasicoccus fimbriatus]|uniref:DUF5069 domain-containing protein n=1 Tax=Cerasicoccus fimbriatus TaxID=3014554 RepID=UPI0022B3418F|nr:DUF5069 domain-containing protein [Cerasicoccus sp. TK19100]
MSNYQYHQTLHKLWQKAVDQYAAGQRDSATYFTREEAQWLADNGVTPQEIYDFAEDYNSVGDPDFNTFAMITDVRRSYFKNQLKGQRSGKQIDPAELPAKDAEADGFVWLPRIIAKARAKLKGELDNDTMYSCGGDRKFLQRHDIHPAQFLKVVADHFDDDSAIVAWVKRHTGKA